MGQSEARGIIDLIASLKTGRAVLIVEHDMDAVFELADRLTVMHDGHEALKEHVKQSVGPWKYPRWIEVVDALPKTATGKIQRFKLREG